MPPKVPHVIPANPHPTRPGKLAVLAAWHLLGFQELLILHVCCTGARTQGLEPLRGFRLAVWVQEGMQQTAVGAKGSRPQAVGGVETRSKEEFGVAWPRRIEEIRLDTKGLSK